MSERVRHGGTATSQQMWPNGMKILRRRARGGLWRRRRNVLLNRGSGGPARLSSNSLSTVCF